MECQSCLKCTKVKNNGIYKIKTTSSLFCKYSISTFEGKEIELVNSYTYLGIIIDSKQRFKNHINNLV